MKGPKPRLYLDGGHRSNFYLFVLAGSDRKVNGLSRAAGQGLLGFLDPALQNLAEFRGVLIVKTKM